MSLRKSLLPVAAMLCILTIAAAPSALAGERRPRVNPYGGYDNDGAGLLDAINRDHGRPAPPPPPVIRHSRGVELDPYNPDKFWRDERGMLDAINRDYGRPAPPPPVVVDRPGGKKDTNPYREYQYRTDSTGLIDAINRDFPRSGTGRR